VQPPTTPVKGDDRSINLYIRGLEVV